VKTFLLVVLATLGWCVFVAAWAWLVLRLGRRKP
jgi:hypothetical protein